MKYNCTTIQKFRVGGDFLMFFEYKYFMLNKDGFI